MAGVYELILLQQAQRGQDVRDAEFAKFDEEYGESRCTLPAVVPCHPASPL
jgi:hypothetical protein